jgi:gliding motility-associated-like protein
MYKYFVSLNIFLAFTVKLVVGQSEQIFTYKFLETDDPQNKSVVAFSTNAPTGATNFSWNFGQGGATSTETNPTFEYNISSTTLFTVSHSYTSNSENISQEIEIEVNPAYFVVLSDYELGELASLKKVFRSVFMIEENHPDFLGNMRFEWTFSGFQPSNYSFSDISLFDYPNVYHTFSNGGSYAITLEVHNVNSPANKKEYTEIINLLPIFGSDKIDFENLPNVITPNGDSINDYFEVVASGTSRLSFKVFTRSGQLVYQHEANVVKWDGKNYYGKDLPEGIYYYILEDLDGKYNPAKGFFYIYR